MLGCEPDVSDVADGSDPGRLSIIIKYTPKSILRLLRVKTVSAVALYCLIIVARSHLSQIFHVLPLDRQDSVKLANQALLLHYRILVLFWWIKGRSNSRWGACGCGYCCAVRYGCLPLTYVSWLFVSSWTLLQWHLSLTCFIHTHW